MSEQTAIDRARLKSDLQAVAKLVAKIASAQIKEFVKENEIDLPMPSLVLSQGLRLILLSRVDRVCALPDPELRNVLRLAKWHLELVLPELPADIAAGRAETERRAPPHKIEAVQHSLAMVLQALATGGSTALSSPEEPELTAEQIRDELQRASS